MQAILSDMRAAFRNLADDGPSMVVLLVIGYVIAWVVTFAATIALVMLFFGSGGSLPLWLAYIPGLLGGAFMVVTIGSIARSMVTMESGDDSRSRAWGAIPLVVLMSARRLRCPSTRGSVSRPTSVTIAVTQPEALTTPAIGIAAASRSRTGRSRRS